MGLLLYFQRKPLKAVTFRLTEEKLQALDSVADLQQRDRSFVINETLAHYLSLNEYHRSLIEEGLRQGDAGDVIEHQTLMNTVAGWAANGTRIASEQLKSAIDFVSEDNPKSLRIPRVLHGARR